MVNEFSLDPDGRCHVCQGGEPGFHEAYTFGLYEGALRDLVHLLKYQQMKPLARRLGEMLNAALPEGRSYDAVVPVPLHWRRRWTRGFNQCALLAAEVGRRRAIPVVEPVRRIRPTSSQTGLTDDQRRRNVASAFRVMNGKPVDGRRIVLVDDVMTTGATASACAMALRRAGARSVTLLTLARVDRRFSHPASSYAASGLVSR